MFSNETHPWKILNSKGPLQCSKEEVSTVLCSLLPVVPPALPVPATNQNQYLKHILLLKKNDYLALAIYGKPI
jgi:hypothetical protein